MRIYENGFTAHSGEKLQICLWKEIKTYQRREPKPREIVKLKNGEMSLGSTEKEMGEIIFLIRICLEQ